MFWLSVAPHENRGRQAGKQSEREQMAKIEFRLEAIAIGCVEQGIFYCEKKSEFAYE